MHMQYVCICIYIYTYTGKSHFMPGLCFWNMSCKSKLRKSTAKFPFKTLHVPGVKGLTTSSYIAYDYTTIGHMDMCRYTLHIHFYTVYIDFYTSYLFISNAIKMLRLTSKVFGMVHCNRTVVVLLHKHFSSWLTIFCNSISIIMNCMYANNIMA